MAQQRHGTADHGGTVNHDNRFGPYRDANKIPILLSCDHDLWFLKSTMPKSTDHLWCPRCQEYRVVKTLRNAYRIKCDDCRYGKQFGAAKVTAHTKAASHALTRHHRVRVYLGNEEVHAVGRDAQAQQPLF